MQCEGTHCRNQIGDAMRDHPRFAASRSGKDQQRTFDVLHGVSLGHR